MKSKISLLIIISILFSCSTDDDNPDGAINVRINHYRNTGIGEGLFLTYLIQEGDAIGTDNWTKFYGNIEGFNYEPGKIYNLSIITEELANPIADASSLKYILQEVISIEEVNSETLFDIDLKINGQNFVTTNSGYELLNQIEINCNTLCEQLNTSLLNQDFLVGTFKRISQNSIQLVELE